MTDIERLAAIRSNQFRSTEERVNHLEARGEVDSIDLDWLIAEVRRLRKQEEKLLAMYRSFEGHVYVENDEYAKLCKEVRWLREEAEGLLSTEDEALIARSARAAALEEAAKVAGSATNVSICEGCRCIADRIRALKDKP